MKRVRVLCFLNSEVGRIGAVVAAIWWSRRGFQTGTPAATTTTPRDKSTTQTTWHSNGRARTYRGHSFVTRIRTWDDKDTTHVAPTSLSFCDTPPDAASEPCRVTKKHPKKANAKRTSKRCALKPQQHPLPEASPWRVSPPPRPPLLRGRRGRPRPSRPPLFSRSCFSTPTGGRSPAEGSGFVPASRCSAVKIMSQRHAEGGRTTEARVRRARTGDR